MESFWSRVGWYLPAGWLLLSPFRYHPHTDTATVCGAWVHHAELPMSWPYSSKKLPLKGLTKHNIEEWVNAAVSIAHANGNIIGIGERYARLLHRQMNQLEDIERSPADEESQADGHCHPGHLPGAHSQTPWRQRRHTCGHVLENLEEYQTDNG